MRGRCSSTSAPTTSSARRRRRRRNRTARRTRRRRRARTRSRSSPASASYALAPRHLVIRSAGLFGGNGSRGKGGNFVETILRRARAGETLRVVDDQITAPTYTAHLAAVVVALIAEERRS